MSKPKIWPIQRSHKGSLQQTSVPEVVYMAAYEVYCHIHSPQQAMIEDGCLGGFGLGELAAFLYAKGFPKSEWRKRADEAFRGMEL